MRTQDEVLAKIAGLDDGMFNFRREVLVDCLEFPHAKQYLKPIATEESWAKEATLTDEAARKEMERYLDFAIEKVESHRGISAGRSVQKLAMMAWYLQMNDVVTFLNNSVNYPQYGAPMLQFVADKLGVETPEGVFQDMAKGEVCRDCLAGTQGGCGS